MKCPNCNIEMNNGICLKCGYMSNGNYIEQYKKTDKYTAIRMYNEDYDIMNYNSSKLLTFFLGPFYFSYRNHLLIGFLISIIDLLMFLLYININDSLNYLGSIFSVFAYFNTVFYPIINRAFYIGFSNTICIFIDKCMVKKLMLKSNYIDKLIKHKSKSFLKLFIHILLFIVVIIIFLHLGFKII